MKILTFDSVNKHCVRNCVEESSVHGVDNEDRSVVVRIGRYYCANIKQREATRVWSLLGYVLYG